MLALLVPGVGMGGGEGAVVPDVGGPAYTIVTGYVFSFTVQSYVFHPAARQEVG